MQNYQNYHVIYIDDLSPDGTGDLVEQYIKQQGQEHRVTLIKNKVRKGALANLYSAIISCDDHKVIVTVDGDDWLSHENVLSHLNNVYSQENVWLTYGQYENYPQGGFGCNRLIPQSVIDDHNYRGHIWSTSHLRTFYAWFYKQVKLEDLLFKGTFFPMTWDLSFMFPMLEMSGGKFKFISDTLYYYNMANPINDFKKDENFQLFLDNLIRNKPKYPRLTPNNITWEKNYNNAKADMVVYSCDRPMQLYSLLESIEKYMSGLGNMYVIYKTTDPAYAQAYQQVHQRFDYVEFVKQDDVHYRDDFKPLTLRCAFESPNDYLLFADDDVILTGYIDVNRCIRLMEKTHAYAFYPRLGFNLSCCYMLNCPQKIPPHVNIEDDIYAWQFEHGEYDWQYPHTIDLTIYRKADVKGRLEQMPYTSPNILEGAWATQYDKHKVGLFYDHSKLVNIPMNRVQDDALNGHMGITQEQLLQKFNQGLKIDIEPLYGWNNQSAQAEYRPTFVPR